MKKVTFATLKSLAKKGKLLHQVKREFDGMTDGLESVKSNYQATTLEDIAGFKVTKNYLRVLEDGTIRLSNCCFTVIFREVP